jgi:glycine/D-amino acid oxidase-like deaminating enzyme
VPGVAVVGGGVLGTTTALLAARAGHEVTIFEAELALWTRASASNEGKVHLGLVYALGDEATRRVMLEGALSFADVVDEALGQPFPWAHHTSPAFTYLVAPGSLEGPAELARRYHDLNALLASMPGARRYLGQDVELLVDPAPSVHAPTGLPCFATVERSVEPLALGSAMVAAVRAHPSIEVRIATRVTEVDPATGDVAAGGRDLGRFDAVVVAAWTGQPALLPPGDRPVRNIRLKAAVRLPPRPGHDTVTVVQGPFGDVVAHRGYTYASWYPAGRLTHEQAVAPSTEAEGLRHGTRVRADVADSTVAALASLGLLDGDEEAEAVIGDYILGHGDVDIDRRDSALHSRAEFGVRSIGRLLVPTSFKLTTAPLAARLVVERLP